MVVDLIGDRLLVAHASKLALRKRVCCCVTTNTIWIKMTDSITARKHNDDDMDDNVDDDDGRDRRNNDVFAKDDVLKVEPLICRCGMVLSRENENVQQRSNVVHIGERHVNIFNASFMYFFVRTTSMANKVQYRGSRSTISTTWTSTSSRVCGRVPTKKP